MPDANGKVRERFKTVRFSDLEWDLIVRARRLTDHGTDSSFLRSAAVQSARELVEEEGADRVEPPEQAPRKRTNDKSERARDRIGSDPGWVRARLDELEKKYPHVFRESGRPTSQRSEGQRGSR